MVRRGAAEPGSDLVLQPKMKEIEWDQSEKFTAVKEDFATKDIIQLQISL